MESMSDKEKLMFARIFVVIGIFVSIVGAWTAGSWITSLIFVVIAVIFGAVFYNASDIREWMQQDRKE